MVRRAHSFAHARAHGLTGPAVAEQDEDEDSERLNKLAAFQLKMIRHAMTCTLIPVQLRAVVTHVRLCSCLPPTVPSVKRIVYSTCSVHAIENEHVVRQAIKSEEAANGHFRLGRREEVLPVWQRRGIPEEMDDPGTLSMSSGAGHSCLTQLRLLSGCGGCDSLFAGRRRNKWIFREPLCSDI